jgi:hypothetical protein
MSSNSHFSIQDHHSLPIFSVTHQVIRMDTFVAFSSQYQEIGMFFFPPFLISVIHVLQGTYLQTGTDEVTSTEQLTDFLVPV